VQVPAELLALYDKVRAQYGGLAAAELRARRCEGCRLEINGADLREIAAMPDDEVLRCPECSRILVRTTESGL
jgi:predicted  nucleic acid-binding Zn-ribbon protein